MAIILTKKSDTASSVPLVADLTNAAGGAELAVNTADKRLFTKTSGGTVVELGTNPSSMTLPNGTANGIPYLNASKVLTSGTALTFDGTNLGLGVPPSAWGSSQKAFDVNGSALMGAGTNGYLSANAYFNAGWKYKTTAVAALYSQEDGAHKWSYAASGTAGNAITFTQAMTLNASGYLGIGTTNASYKFHVTGASGGDSLFALTNNTTGATYRLYNASSGDNGFNGFGIYDGTAYRMAIDSSGAVMVGKTNSGYDANGCAFLGNGQIRGTTNNDYPLLLLRNGSDGVIASFWRGGVGQVGTISITTTNTSYNTSSDYRLKENIQPMTGALAKVAALKPVTYTWKADGSAGEGFIAHELAEVCPQAVTGEKDAMRTEQYEISPAVPAMLDAEGNELTPAVEAVMGERQVPAYQGIDVSFLVGTLTAALQELKAEFDAYKAAHP